MTLLRLFSLSLLCTVLGGASAVSKYGPLSFSVMAMSADLVVYGEIVELSDTTFTLAVDELLAGELTPQVTKSKRLEVMRFRDWACARRWTNYAQGQEVVLFLKHERGGFRILSGGGEGEMPLVVVTDKSGRRTRRVLVRSRAQEKLGERDSHTIHGAKLVAVPIDLDVLVKAVRGLRQCFRFEGPMQALRSEQIADRKAVDDLASSSKLASKLVGRARDLLP